MNRIKFLKFFNADTMNQSSDIGEFCCVLSLKSDVVGPTTYISGGWVLLSHTSA